MKCGRPKWMLRQLFHVFFLSILSILIIAAVLAYLVYFLPSYPPRSLYKYSDHQQYQNQRTFARSAIHFQSAASSSSGDSTGSASLTNHLQDLHLIKLETAPIRHVSSRGFQLRQQDGGGASGGDGALLERPLEGKDGLPEKCSMFTCFDIHRCGGVDANKNGSLSVYVYPIYRWVVDGKQIQDSLSYEFYQFLESIKRSPYYVPDPKHACIFVPSIDLLNLNKLSASSEDILAVLSSLEFWGNSGQNHVLLTMFPGNSPLLHLQTKAVVASSGLFTDYYRLGFHIPVISPSPLLFLKRSSTSISNISNNNNSSSGSVPSSNNAITNGGSLLGIAGDKVKEDEVKTSASWIAAAVLHGAFSSDDLLTSANHDNSILLLDYCRRKNPKEHVESRNRSRDYSVRCSKSGEKSGSDVKEYEYPDILRSVDFCLIMRDLASPVLWEVMSVGCIPVFFVDHQRLPFDEFIDWRRTSVQLYEHQIHQLSSILISVSQSRRRRLKAQVQLTFQTHFRDMTQITGTLLTTLQDRVFTHYARSIHEWNENAELHLKYSLTNVQSPLFNPVIAPKEAGFTAVILAYERVASLFSVIQRVALVPSLAKIIVVWNNQLKDPPSLDSWPKVGVPVKIIKSKENKMSNRFVPYDEIETEAVFSLDDDIIMLTIDEMEFGFDTWREFPDRIVGFPSRSHVWDNSTHRWKYESEWTSEISMVLTGAAFYHKYWHYAYTNELPRDIREWVDAKMNCEDIAMNFLVSARTGKSPIKVTPRKKFKCPTCSNNEMLSADTGHMVERTDCINKFTQVMGFMPLVPTEFRADPVLFKVDGLPNRLKHFHDMGTM